MRCARVSSADQTSDKPGIIGYMIREKHWSPFEMVHMCVEINTTRDIGRQILRHGKGFSFQEYSQRYAAVPLGDGAPADEKASTDEVTERPPLREARTQDTKNRQNSHGTDDVSLKRKWDSMQQEVRDVTDRVYAEALSMGIAKEVARAVLPEGLTPTKMYMTGNLRSFIHYCQLRCGNGTQKEHKDIADQVKAIFIGQFPLTAKALGWQATTQVD
jgi:thymidylate synthase (FAD)